MTICQSVSRNGSAPGNSACVVIAFSIIFTASGLMAEDGSGTQPAKDSRLELLQSIDSRTSQAREPEDAAPHQSRPAFGDLDTAASGLNDALDGARSKLDQLREAANFAAIAATLRDELEAAAEENNRLALALTKAEANQRSLEASLDKSGDQIETLTKELGDAKSDASDLAQEVRNSRGETKTIDTARGAAVERAERAENQLAATREQNQGLSRENRALKNKLDVARAERDDARNETAVTLQERDTANQELDTIRLRIAGLLRSVLHADKSVDAAASQKNATTIVQQAASADTETNGRNYKIIQTSNIRAEPNRLAERVAIGARGENVSVLRKVSGDNWFEVKTRTGVTGFIFGELLQPE